MSSSEPLSVQYTPVTVLLPHPLHLAVRQAARDQRRPVSAFLRNVIEDNVGAPVIDLRREPVRSSP
jgi:hypothetical protein